jgi:membrane-associated phospholipid phosphatase
LLAGIASFLAGLAVLVVLNAPQQLVALVVAMLAALAATTVVTLWWKLSLHAAAASGTVAILALSFGPALTLAVPLVAVVAWSRVRLGDHTPAQTVAGAILGALVGSTVFIMLR